METHEKWGQVLKYKFKRKVGTVLFNDRPTRAIQPIVAPVDFFVMQRKNKGMHQ